MRPIYAARHLILTFVFYYLVSSVAAQTTLTYSTAGTYSWTAPCGVTSVTVELWGGGGGGGYARGTAISAGGGGGGGGYARSVISVTPGNSYTIVVGAGGFGGAQNGTTSSTDGGQSSFQTTLVMAAGGNAGKDANGSYALGGAGGISNFGTFVQNGGNGADGISSGGGGGGSSAGTTNAGNPGSGSAGGIAVTAGGAGGSGSLNMAGGNGLPPGGGGAGGNKNSNNRAGGDGGTGKASLTFTALPTYCSPTFTNGIEPITNVTFAGINNSVAGSSANEIFCSPTGSVYADLPHSISVQGNTVGNYTNYFRLYADWNQDGDFVDAGESYYLGTITNSTGNDGNILTSNILVPATATPGTTTIRILKRYNSDPTNPCQTGSGYGQAENYNITVAIPPACVAPVAQPTGLSFGTITSTSIAGSFNASATATGYLVIQTETAIPPSAPQDGVTYGVNSLALGGMVVGNGNAPSFASTALTPSTQYWYWIYAYRDICAGQPKYLAVSPLNGTATTLACSGSGTNMLELSGTSNTYYWSTANWTLGHPPTACEDVVINYTRTGNNSQIVFLLLDQNVTLKSLQLEGIYGGDAYFYPKSFNFYTQGFNITVLNDLAMKSNGGYDNLGEGFPDAHEVSFLATAVSGKNSLITIKGNTTVGAVTDKQVSTFGGGTASDPSFILKGNVVYSACGSASYPGTYYFSKNGTASLTNNMLYYVLLFSNAVVGANASTQLTVNGTDGEYTGVYGGNLTIKSGASLTLPDSSGFGQVRLPALAEGIFTLEAGAQLNLEDETSGMSYNAGTFPGISGSNFPSNFGTYSIASGSTVNYSGKPGSNQTVYPGITYGNLTLSNASASGNSTKSLTANTSIAGNLSVNSFASFDLATYTANRTSAGGTLSMADNAIMKVGGSSGGAGANNNFPANYSTYTLNAASTIEYSGAASQGIYGTPVYGNLNIGGANTKTAPSGTLTVTGDLLKSGSSTFAHNNGRVLMNGTFQSFAGLDYNSLELTGSAKTTGGNAAIYDSLKLNASTVLNITAGQTITIKSTGNKTARVGAIPASASINYYDAAPVPGKFIVERHIKNGRRWRVLSFPTQSTNQSFYTAWQEAGANTMGYGTLIGDPRPNFASFGFDMQNSNGSSIKIFSFPNSYVPINNTMDLISTYGVHPAFMSFVASDRRMPRVVYPNATATVLRSSGKLFTGDQHIPLTGTDIRGIGNPFASPIDMFQVLKPDQPNQIMDFQVFDPQTMGGYNLGRYTAMTWMGPNFEPTPGPYTGSYDSLNVNPNVVESGSGFYTQSNNPLVTEVVIPEAAKSINPPPFSFTSGSIQSLRANLKVHTASGVVLADGIRMLYHDDFANAVNPYDVKKILNTGENVSILSGGSRLIVERRQNVMDNDTIQLVASNWKVQNYEWEMILDNMDFPGRTAYFVDRYTNATTALNMSGITNISFSIQNIPGSYAANRFYIVFKQQGVVPVTFTSLTAARSGNDAVSLRFKVENEINISRYEIEQSSDGLNFMAIAQQAPANSGGAGVYDYLHSNAGKAAGFYRIKAIDIDGSIQYSNVAKVKAITGNGGFSVFPNPVADRQLQLHYEPAQAGKYRLRILGANGQEIFRRDISLTTAGIMQIALPASIAAGTYRLSLDGTGENTLTETIIVQ